MIGCTDFHALVSLNIRFSAPYFHVSSNHGFQSALSRRTLLFCGLRLLKSLFVIVFFILTRWDIIPSDDSLLASIRGNLGVSTR